MAISYFSAKWASTDKEEYYINAAVKVLITKIYIVEFQHLMLKQCNVYANICKHSIDLTI